MKLKSHRFRVDSIQDIKQRHRARFLFSIFSSVSHCVGPLQVPYLWGSLVAPSFLPHSRNLKGLTHSRIRQNSQDCPIGTSGPHAHP